MSDYQDHKVNNIVQTAIKTSKWYREHCEAVNATPSIAAARYLYFAVRVERDYYRDYPNEERLTAVELLAAAAELALYYCEHVHAGRK